MQYEYVFYFWCIYLIKSPVPIGHPHSNDKNEDLSRNKNKVALIYYSHSRHATLELLN